MTRDPCNPQKIIHHQVIGRIKHRGHISPRHPHHHAHHVTTDGCPKLSVLDQKRFGAMPTFATAVKLATLPALLGGTTAIIAYSGGFDDLGTWSGGGIALEIGNSFKCTKYTEHRHRCSHLTQVPEPATFPVFVAGLLAIALLRQLTSKIRKARKGLLI